MIDLVFPLSLDGSGSFASSEDPKIVWRGRVMSVLSTYVGARVMRPRFGTRSVDLAFENKSTAEGMAKSVVTSALSQSLPAVRVVSVTTTSGLAWATEGMDVHVVYESPAGEDEVSVPMSSEALALYADGYVSFENLAIGGN